MKQTGEGFGGVLRKPILDYNAELEDYRIVALRRRGARSSVSPSVSYARWDLTDSGPVWLRRVPWFCLHVNVLRVLPRIVNSVAQARNRLFLPRSFAR